MFTVKPRETSNIVIHNPATLKEGRKEAPACIAEQTHLTSQHGPTHAFYTDECRCFVNCSRAVLLFLLCILFSSHNPDSMLDIPQWDGTHRHWNHRRHETVCFVPLYYGLHFADTRRREFTFHSLLTFCTEIPTNMMRWTAN